VWLTFRPKIMLDIAHLQCLIDALMPSSLITGSSPTTSAEWEMR